MKKIKFRAFYVENQKKWTLLSSEWHGLDLRDIQFEINELDTQDLQTNEPGMEYEIELTLDDNEFIMFYERNKDRIELEFYKKCIENLLSRIRTLQKIYRVEKEKIEKKE